MQQIVGGCMLLLCNDKLGCSGMIWEGQWDIGMWWEVGGCWDAARCVCGWGEAGYILLQCNKKLVCGGILGDQ